jgi:hypothetical protein
MSRNQELCKGGKNGRRISSGQIARLIQVEIWDSAKEDIKVYGPLRLYLQFLQFNKSAERMDQQWVSASMGEEREVRFVGFHLDVGKAGYA